jgi:hypothetical protein
MEEILTVHTQNYQKQQACFQQVQAMSNLQAKSRIWPIYRNVSKSWDEMDREFVNCRRQRKLTVRYRDLEQKFEECITTFNHWALIAALTY